MNNHFCFFLFISRLKSFGGFRGGPGFFFKGLHFCSWSFVRSLVGYQLLKISVIRKDQLKATLLPVLKIHLESWRLNNIHTEIFRIRPKDLSQKTIAKILMQGHVEYHIIVQKSWLNHLICYDICIFQYSKVRLFEDPGLFFEVFTILSIGFHIIKRPFVLKGCIFLLST